MITKGQVGFLLQRKERLGKLIEILENHNCTYWDDTKCDFVKSKDLLDFVTLGIDGLTMRDIKKVLEVM